MISSSSSMHAGKLYPLHEATREGVVHTVQGIINSGVPIWQKDAKGETALHVAVRFERVAVARYLIQLGASGSIKNKAGESPADLARRSSLQGVKGLFAASSKKSNFYANRNSAKISLIDRFGHAPSPPIARQTTSALTHLERQFLQSYDRKEIKNTILYLKKMSGLFLAQKKEYKRAAHLLCAAIEVASKAKDKMEDPLLTELEELEAKFVRDRFGALSLPKAHAGSISRNRSTLFRIRLNGKKFLKQRSPHELQSHFTGSYMALFRTIIEECIDLIPKQKRPRDWAVAGLGSMARGEMCRNSDIEYLFLTSDSSSENISRLAELQELLALRMIGMGETKFKVVKDMRREESVVPDGFRIDSGALTPAGMPGLYQLIGTPEHLARMQTMQWFDRHSSEVIVVNAQTCACKIMGKAGLVGEYKLRVRAHLNTPHRDAPLLREQRALQNLRENLSEFHPKLNAYKIDILNFDVKAEMYRLPQMVISSLALFYGLKTRSTIKRIDELEKKGVFSNKGATQLRSVFALILQLRLETHFFYQDEKERIEASKQKSSAHLFPMTDKIRGEVIKIYQCLIPLYQQTKLFLKGDRKAYRRSDLCNTTVGRYRDSMFLQYDFGSAEPAALAACALEPHNPDFRRALGKMYLKLAKAQEAAGHFDYLLANLKKESNCPPSYLARTLTRAGEAHQGSQDLDRAIALYQEAVSIYMKLLKLPKFDNTVLATSKGNSINPEIHNALKGALFESVTEQINRIKSVFNEAVLVQLLITLTHLGSAQFEKKQAGYGLETYKKALQIHNELIRRGGYGVAAAHVLTRMAITLVNWSNPQRAQEYLEQAIRLYKTYDTRMSPEYAETLTHYGFLLRDRKEHKRALENQVKAVKIMRRVYRRDHPGKALAIKGLGMSYRASCQPKKALSLYVEARDMLLRIQRDELQEELANLHYLLGNLYFENNPKRGIWDPTSGEASYKEAYRLYQKSEANYSLYRKEELCAYQLALGLERAQRWDDAWNWYSTVLKRRPKSGLSSDPFAGKCQVHMSYISGMRKLLGTDFGSRLDEESLLLREGLAKIQSSKCEAYILPTLINEFGPASAMGKRLLSPNR